MDYKQYLINKYQWKVLHHTHELVDGFIYFNHLTRGDFDCGTCEELQEWQDGLKTAIDELIIDGKCIKQNNKYKLL